MYVQADQPQGDHKQKKLPMPQKGHRKCRCRHVYQRCSLSALPGIYTQLSICMVVESKRIILYILYSLVELIQKYRVIFPLNKELCTHKWILVYLRLLPLHVLQNKPISCLRVASINLWKEVFFHTSIPDYLKLPFIQFFFSSRNSSGTGKMSGEVCKFLV